MTREGRGRGRPYEPDPPRPPLSNGSGGSALSYISALGRAWGGAPRGSREIRVGAVTSMWELHLYK